MPLTIAIDYDDTFTKDPHLWNGFVSSALGRGIDVYIVTMRSPDQVGDLHKVAHTIPKDRVVFTALQAKRPYMRRHHSVHVDIWIDDSPQYVDNDHPALENVEMRWMDVSQFNSGYWRKS